MEDNVYAAFEQAAKDIAAETGRDYEDVMKTMKKLIYLFITRI